MRLRQALPAIMSQIQLRRIFNTPVIDRHRVLQQPQEEIPGYTIITVELRLSPEEVREHNTFFHVLALEFEAKRRSYLETVDASGAVEEKFRFPFGIWRRMGLLASSMIFERSHNIVPPGGTLNKAIQGWRADQRDYRFLVNKTVLPGDPISRIKGEYIRHLCYGSPKLRYFLCVIIPQVVIGLTRKLRVFSTVPRIKDEYFRHLYYKSPKFPGFLCVIISQVVIRSGKYIFLFFSTSWISCTMYSQLCTTEANTCSLSSA